MLQNAPNYLNLGRTNITSSAAATRKTDLCNGVADRDGWEDRNIAMMYISTTSSSPQQR